MTPRRRPREVRVMTASQVRRAIYIDFEGRKVLDEPPALLGVLYEGDPDEPGAELIFRQYVLDSALWPLAGRGPNTRRAVLTEIINWLIRFSESEHRHLVSWSLHDSDLIRRWSDHTAFRHRTAIPTARRWRAGRTSLGPGCPDVEFSGNHLQSYLQLIGYSVPEEVRQGAAGWIAYVRARMEGAGGDPDRLSPAGRRDWERLVEHNRHDCFGMRAVVQAAVGLGSPR